MKFTVVYKKIKKFLFVNSQEIYLYKFLFLRKNNQSKNPKKIVLIQGVQSLYYFGLFGVLAGKLREHNDVSVDIFHLKSITPAFGNNCLNFFRLLFVDFLENKKWIFLYKAYSDRIGYRSASISLLYDSIDFLTAIKIWRGISSKGELLKLKIFGIHVGDLIYDSYLRYKPSPTVDIADSYLLLLIWQAQREVRRASKYFSNVKPDMYLTSYSTYIEHGIAIRVALKYAVRVISVIFYLKFWKELSIQDMTILKNGDYYYHDFKKFADQENLLSRAKKAMLFRLNGGIDSSNSYMRNVPKKKYDNLDHEINGAVIIFLHDFFDSPHIYKDSLFCDFFEWAIYTIDFLKKEGIKFCVKPHPNQIEANLAVIKDLKNRYPDVVFIPNDISNSHMVQLGILGGITVYGSVAHELAFLGIPTIACSYNPHMSFSFCKTAKTVNEYDDMIRKIHNLEFCSANAKEESLIFYYMHFLNNSETESEFLNLLGEWFNKSHSAFIEAKDLTQTLGSIKKSKAFQKEAESLKALL